MWTLWLTLSAAQAELPPKLTETLKTRDGVRLEVDIYPAPAGASGVILLHMIPPHFDRTSWPTAFIESLRAKGWSVCVPDRRGAGASKGVAEQAYTGDTGRYDVEVCVKRLSADGLGELAVIGASNGTTSALDYAVWAKTEGDLPVPAALGFMTGGEYTVAQNTLGAVADIPSIFTFSTAERQWSAESEGAQPAWVHVEYPDGEHGTKMFGVRPEVGPAIVTFLDTQL